MEDPSSPAPLRLTPDTHGAILDTLSALVVVLDRDRRIVLFNEACAAATGWPVEEALGRAFDDLLLLDEEKPAVNEVLDAIFRGEYPSRHENRWLARDGSQRRIVWTNTGVADTDGTVIYAVGTGIDITEQFLAERARDESVAWNQAVLDAAIDAMITIEADGTIVSFNGAAERMFGHAAADVVGRNVNLLMPRDYADRHDAYLERYHESGEKRIIGIGREVEAKRKDGSTFPCRLSVSEVRLAHRLRFAGIIHDLTEVKRAHEEATRASTLAAVGEMAASIAHEVKNPLASISAVLQNLRKRLPEEEEHGRAMVDEAREAVRRLDATIRQMLLFARSWNPRRRECDLTAVVERVVAATEGVALFEAVEFVIAAEPGALADVDRSMAEQVLLNLFQNAAQAMDGPGTIRVTLATGARGVAIVIEDDGAGIPEETRRKLFRPFFTTKDAGTGLGLANCLKMMEAHEGSITVEPADPRGTRIRLFFPRGIAAPPA